MVPPKPASTRSRRGSGLGWTFLTNHAQVLLCLSRDPASRMRDIAAQVGITERAVQKIVSDLEEAGYLTRARTGRRNSYEIHLEQPMRHPLHRSHRVHELLDLLEGRRVRRE